MARQRKRPDSTVQTDSQGQILVVGENKGESTMSSVFETLTREEWISQGAGQSARKGEHGQILVQFAETGQRYGQINTSANGNGRFAGKKASTVATALKQARDAKNAPENVQSIQVSSKSEKGAEGIGMVYLENEAVEAA